MNEAEIGPRNEEPPRASWQKTGLQLAVAVLLVLAAILGFCCGRLRALREIDRAELAQAWRQVSELAVLAEPVKPPARQTSNEMVLRDVLESLVHSSSSLDSVR